MYIKEAEFKNFQNFMTGLGLTYLKFDFTTRKNPVCIIIGPNGSGKTSLLSYLTPFATMGTLDVRESNRIIIPKKDGYKRIVFVDEMDNEFEIEHFYTYSEAKDTFTIKSYIKMNGMEMNENGNVSSFKELVNEYLDVDISFLKLVRIGKNVSNLISAKSTERKSFMGKILEDVDWYLKKFKDINEKEKALKVLMMHTMDELKKTEIDDLSNTEVELKEIDKRITKYKELIDKYKGKESTILYKLEELNLPPTCARDLSSMEKLILKLETSLEEARSNNYTSVTVSNFIEELEGMISDKEHQKDILNNDLIHTINQMDNLASHMDELSIAITKEETLLNLTSLEEYLVSKKKEANLTFRQAFEELPITISKDEFEDLYVILKNQQRVLNLTYEFGRGPVAEVIKGMRKNENIPNLITASLLAIESRENKERLSLIQKLITKYAGVQISCKEDCVLKFLHQELIDIKDSEPVNTVKFTAEFYHLMKLAYDNISHVFAELSNQKENIKKLPADIQSIFTIENLSNKISNCEMVYDEKVLNDLLSFLTERENYYKLQEEIKTLEIELEERKKNSKANFLKEELEKDKEKNKELTQSYDTIREELDQLEEEISISIKKKDNMQSMLEALLHYESKKEEYETLKSKYLNSLELTEELKDVQKNLKELREMEASQTNQKFQIRNNIENYKNLTANLQTQKITYEDYDNLKFALSSKTGIPLIHIKNYLKRTVVIANQIIDIAYGGELRLCEFEITINDFKMPYIKNGIVIDDVISASQGEESFFNLAISSALRSQSMTRFNIGLFDEVDSEFDDTNRQHFIPVLEKTLELNGINQAFLITHNLMFRQYPVDIINLGDIDASTITVEYE